MEKNHFGPLWWEKYGTTKVGCSESYWANLVGKDWKKSETIKLGHSGKF